jgi:uncharacterized protein YkwD
VRLERTLGLLAGGLGIAILLTLAITYAPPAVAGANRDAAARMVSLVNEARAEHDLPALTSANDVADVAESWSAVMATDDHLRHNPDYGAQICCWSRLTENVAFSDPYRLWRPGDPVELIVDELHDRLLESPGHRVNILDPFVDEIGIGVHVSDDGSIWITQNFRQRALR